MKEERGFSSSFGAILAAAGSAVGLGNVWRFPYLVGQNGGGAFLLIYVFFVMLIGVPMMMTEFIIGRRSQKNAVGSFRALAPKRKAWAGVGFLGVVSALLVYAFYSVVAGWTLNYIVLACSGKLVGQSPEAVSEIFSTFTQSSFLPIFYQVVFLVITTLIITRGVQKGIENLSKVLMPLVFVLLIVMCVRTLMLEGSSKGLYFLFKPDFSKLTANTFLMALGQSFFSLSLGMAAMITYGSYIRKDDRLFKNSVSIAACDTLVAILSGIVIFAAVYAFDIDPTQGPRLVYVVLPNIFNNMPAGTVFAVIFFILLAVAALTSTISLLEILVAFVVEELHWKRNVASWVSTLLVLVIGVFCTLSFGVLKNATIFGNTIFECADKITSMFIIPLGALLTTLFLGWVIPKVEVKDELSNGGTLKVRAFELYYFILRYLAPLAVAVIIVYGFFGK